jgi:hypothetical protein
MSGSEAYYHVGAVLGELGDLVERAWEGIRMDDGRNALAILEAITEEYLDEWEILDGSDGESGEFFNTLGAAFTEAILTADLSKEERDGWMKKLDEWQMAVDDYGIEDAFLAAQEAAARGWDDPPLQAIFQGRTEDAAIEDDDDFEGDEDLEEDEEDEDSDYADELTRARLHLLERRGQWQQYLNLAKATGQTEA